MNENEDVDTRAIEDLERRLGVAEDDAREAKWNAAELKADLKYREERRRQLVALACAFALGLFYGAAICKAYKAGAFA